MDEDTNRVRQLVRWLVVDAVVVAAIIIGASLELDTISSWAQQQFQIVAEHVDGVCRGGGRDCFGAVLDRDGAGVARARVRAGEPRVSRCERSSKLDLAAAPRKLLVVTLQLAIVLLVGIPLVAITQPFVPTLRGAAVLVFLLALLAFAFWRNATNLQGHTRAAAQAMVQAIGRQTRKGRAMEADQLETQAKLDDVNRIITGLGSPVSIELQPGSSAVGRTLAEIKLRGLTGATILAIEREGESVVVPAGNERLRAGDVLAVAGTHMAVEAARELLAADDIDRFSMWQSPTLRTIGRTEPLCTCW